MKNARISGKLLRKLRAIYGPLEIRKVVPTVGGLRIYAASNGRVLVLGVKR